MLLLSCLQMANMLQIFSVIHVYRQDQLYNFQGSVQNENSGPFQNLLRISRQWPQNIKHLVWTLLSGGGGGVMVTV